MAAPERQLWVYLQKGMRRYWDAQRHEDRYQSGIPDVSYALQGVDGWIELKTLPRWPARGILRLTHLTPAQVLWLECRGRKGNGCTWMFLRAGTRYLLVRYTHIRPFLDPIHGKEALRHSVAYWDKQVDFTQLASLLQRRLHLPHREGGPYPQGG